MVAERTIAAADAKVGVRYWTVNGYPVDVLRNEGGEPDVRCEMLGGQKYRLIASQLLSLDRISLSVDAQQEVRRFERFGAGGAVHKRRRAVARREEAKPKPVAGPDGRDPRLPEAGTVLRHGKVEVTVLAEGFEWKGNVYKSLSAIGKEATGRSCNGFAYFGLGRR